MRHLVLFILSAMLFSACVHNNPQPAWLSIGKWTLVQNTDPFANDAGELTQNITDGWIYVNDKLIGNFELPCKIPVLMSGTAEVKVYPSIRNNGISATKKIYPFCDAYTVNLELAEGQIYAIAPVTRYSTATRFWKEDFEDFSLLIETDANSNAELTRENDPSIALSGYYGRVHLNASSDSLWQATTQALVLPKGGAEVYLEIDYRNDNALLTGVFAYSSANGATQHPNIGLNSQAAPVWKKTYIDLKEIISYNNSAEYFKQFFRALIDSGKSSGDIYIDNIKVVY